MASVSDGSAENNAENSTSSNEGGNWWNSFVQKAKEKSISALEIIKNDLNEFTTTMRNDFTEVSNQLKETNKPLIESLTKITLNPSNTNANKKNILNQNKQNVYDRYKNDLKLLQNCEETYLKEPNEVNLDEYKNWLLNFDPDTQKGVISDLLIENTTMRGIYSQLVPAVISNQDFWSRYFFKVNLFEKEHKTRTKLIEKATASGQSDENMNWDEEDDWNDSNKEEKSIVNETSKEETEEVKEESNIENIVESNVENESKEERNENTILEESKSNEKIESEIKTSETDLKLKDYKSEADSDEWEKDFELSIQDAEKTLVASKNPKTSEKNDDEKKNDEWENWD